ncbi:MAG: hypothetical protein AAAC47_25910 [Pararhizobium sp.]
MKTCIKAIERADGKARVTFVDHGNGLYSFGEEQVLEDEVPGFGPYTYWSPTYESGLYAEFATAEREAKAVIKWLEEEI